MTATEALLDAVFYLEGEEVYRRASGKEVSTASKTPYIAVYVRTVNGVIVREQYHRIKYYLKHRYLPAEVDHKDRNPRNNLLANLRASDRTSQLHNRGSWRTSELPRGVFKVKSGKYEAVVQYRRVRHGMGRFATPEEASKAVEAKLRELHGEHYEPPVPGACTK